jgi:hypothetical protein
MKEIILGFSFIFSILLYLGIALFLRKTIKPSFVFKTDIGSILYIVSFLIYLSSLYISKFGTYQKKVISLALAEVPAIIALIYFFLTGDINILIKISIISILVILYITFLKGEGVEN